MTIRYKKTCHNCGALGTRWIDKRRRRSGYICPKCNWKGG